MKKSIVLAMLGVAAGVTASYGQGTVGFFNYFSPSSPVVSYAASNVPIGKAGLAVGSGFTAELAWFNGVTANSAALTLVPSSETAFGLAAPSPTADGQLSYGAGWFLGPNVSLGAAAGSTVTLEVIAFNAGSTVTGQSGLFQVTLGGGGLPPASIAAGGSFTVANAVPEPTTMALGGLGLAAMLVARRKKA